MWSLASNDGLQRLDWQPKELISKGDVYVLSDLRLIGSYWDPSVVLAADEFVLAEHASIAMPNELLSLRCIDLLIEKLRGWFVSPTPFEINLPSEYSGEFVLRLGPGDELISSVEKPIWAFSYSSPQLQWRWLMVVDETCLRSFLSDVNRWRVGIEES